jgi:hypothetical protein
LSPTIQGTGHCTAGAAHNRNELPNFQFTIFPPKMDRQSVFTSRLYGAPSESEDSNTQIRSQLESFILDFRLDNVFIYRSVSKYYGDHTSKSVLAADSQR